jgi:hypothetical protein
MADSDPISRALRRNNGIAGSPLEKSIRLNAYKLVNGTETDDAKLDAFIREQRQDPFYSASFSEPPGPTKAAGIDTLRLSKEQMAAIDRGELVIEPEAERETATISTATVRPNSEAELDEIIATGKVGK